VEVASNGIVGVSCQINCNLLLAYCLGTLHAGVCEAVVQKIWSFCQPQYIAVQTVVHCVVKGYDMLDMSLRKKVKLAHTRLQSVGFRSSSRFLAVSLQVTRVINLAVGCHYFPSGLQLPPQPLRGLLPVSLLGEQRHDGCEQFV